MLTKKQLDLLDFINKRVQRDGVPPSFDEMKEALDLRSKSGIHRLITALEERGFIRRLAHRARAIEIVKLPDSMAPKSGGFTPKIIDGDRPDTPRPARRPSGGPCLRSGSACHGPDRRRRAHRRHQRSLPQRRRAHQHDARRWRALRPRSQRRFHDRSRDQQWRCGRHSRNPDRPKTAISSWRSSKIRRPRSNAFSAVATPSPLRPQTPPMKRGCSLTIRSKSKAALSA